MNTFTTISLVAGAVIVIGGVAYVVYKRSNPGTKLPVLDVFEVSDILNWIDEVLPTIKTEEGVNYVVKILPSADTQHLLTRKVKNAHAFLFVAQKEGKFTILKQKVIVAKSLASELQTLNEGKIVEMPIQI